MGNYQIKDLLEKYEAGTCTDKEKAVLETWYLNWKSADDITPEESLIETSVDKIWQRLESDNPVPSIVPIWPKLLAAAVLLIVLGATAYIYTNGHKKATSNLMVVNDLKPGTNKATLTLSNGTKVTLDTVSNGVIAQQGVMSVKSQNGKLLYLNVNESQQADVVDYNTLTTPKGGEFQLVLPDGSQVWLNAASSIRYPTKFIGNQRKVEITGEAYFEVAKDKTRPFFVAAEGETIEVLGTHFNVNAYKDEVLMNTTLLEGAVKISAGGNQKQLSPGEQSLVNPETNSIEVSKSPDAEAAIAWKNGKFVFNATDIRTIMRQFSRWYDVDVYYSGKVPNYTLSGKFNKNMNAAKALKILEYTGLKFTIEGRKIIVK